LSVAEARGNGTPGGFLARIKTYYEFTRPFTLLPPTFGVISGAVTAWGSASNPDPARGVTLPVILTVFLGSLCAALLNAASNGINQFYDIENDRRNKPKRHLVTGAITMIAGYRFSLVLYALAVLPTWLVVTYPRSTFGAKLFAPLPQHQCIVIYVIGMIATFVYSAPAWGRTKAHPLGANVTIAIPRGCLLKVAGWSMVASVYHLEPWYIGSIFGFFLLGAATTKDFSDMEGDRIARCLTLPIKYGVRRAAWIIAPFFVLPWLLIPLGALLRNPFDPAHHILTGHPALLTALGLLLAVWGGYTVYLLVRNPDDLARVENHPSWTHMYLMMMAAQIGFAVAYIVPHTT
jgi:4-hydroxybenzoate polyprenyltransferase